MKHAPAFPLEMVYTQENEKLNGMTLRDYFAAKVMQAAISKNGFYDDEQLFANWCYETADAMIKARDA